MQLRLRVLQDVLILDCDEAASYHSAISTIQYPVDEAERLLGNSPNGASLNRM